MRFVAGQNFELAEPDKVHFTDYLGEFGCAELDLRAGAAKKVRTKRVYLQK